MRRANHMRPLLFFGVLLAMLAGATLLGYGLSGRAVEPPLIEGIFWQPDNATAQPHGNWHLLGAGTMVVQWLMVDDKAWFPSSVLSTWQRQPDWQRIAREPWAADIVAGLSGRYNEREARTNLPQLGRQSLQVSDSKLPFTPKAYYFPVEADPSWLHVHRLRQVLERLPRPLWVSVYAGERAPEHFDLWVQSWLPDDVRLFFQDGVGVGVRTPQEARRIADSLVRRFGSERVAIVLEAFRPNWLGDGFSPASLRQLTAQLQAYCGLRIYAFDGPHYLSKLKVRMLNVWARWWPSSNCSEGTAATH